MIIGDFKKGSIKAELDIKENLWFFDCHFKEDPVMPGCLGLRCDVATSWFLSWLAWKSWKRKGSRSWNVKFTGEVLKNCKNS